MSSFDGEDLFGTGPHRFEVGPVGAYVYEHQRLDPTQPGSAHNGGLEAQVVVVGRLVAQTESALRGLESDVEAMLTDPPTAGVLLDGNGRSWSGMSFIRFERTGPVDRGAAISVAYRAVFRRFV